VIRGAISSTSRRAAGRGGAIACLAVLLASCQSSEPAPDARAATAAPAAAARRLHPPNLFTASFADPKTFNPIIVVDANSVAAVADVFESLVRLDPRTAAMEPALAERWETNADGTAVTFFLRKDVRWHDGEPFTAADVVFTFDALYDERVPNSLKSILTIDGQRIAVEALDDSTVRLRLPHPFAPLLNAIAGLMIVPKHVLGPSLEAGEFARQWGIDTPPERIVGTGPYRLDRYVPAQYVHWVRNPTYWRRDDAGRPLPYLSEQTIRIVPNQDTAYLKFLAGETDVHTPRPEEVPDLRAQAAARDISVQEIGLDTGTLFVTFNRNPTHYIADGKPDPRLTWFTDLHFLRAIAHSIDKTSIINTVLHGYGKPAVSYLSPENKDFYDPNLQDYPYDLERARQLLAEGGYKLRDGVLEDRDGHPIEFTLYTNAGNQLREKICAILKQDWESLGMKVNFKALDFGLLVEKLDATFDWDAMLMGFTGGVEPHNGANLLLSSGNLHLWNPNQQTPATDWEAELDRQVDIGARALDPEQRRQAYWRVQEILNQQLPLIVTVHALRFTAFVNSLQSYVPAVWGVYRPELMHFSE
jgi:peptide/nickel transport system substrate-binding protein